MILVWDEISNIENSLIEFLRSEVTASSLQMLDQNGIAKTVNVYAGKEVNSTWELPLIQVYLDSKPDMGRLEIGSNLRLKSYQLIIDIRTLLSGQETALASWVETVINNGYTVYSYAPNSSNPDNPVKSILGHGRVDFVSSLPVPLFDDADLFDKFRYRITCKIWLT